MVAAFTKKAQSSMVSKRLIYFIVILIGILLFIIFNRLTELLK